MRQLALLVLLLLCTQEGFANNIRYFRHVKVGSPEMYQFRYEVTGADTSQAKVYRVHHDSEGRVISWEYLSGGRQTKDPNWEIAAATIEFSGEEEYHRFYDEFRRPQRLRRSRSFSERRVWLNDRTQTRLDQLEIDGLPIKEDINGCVSYMYELDQFGRIKSEFCLNGQGEKIIRKSGIYEEISEFIDSSRIIRYLLLDKTGNLFDTASPMLTVKRDSFGNEVEVRRFGKDSNLLSRTLPIERWQYDRNGYPIVFEELSAEGALIYRTEYKYDNRGNRLEESEFPVGTSAGKSSIVRRLCEYDDRNHLLRETHVSKTGQHLRQLKYAYTKEGYLKDTEVQDSIGRRSRAGSVSRIQYLRDEYGNAIRTTYLDREDRPVNNWFGYAFIARSFDSLGQIVEIQYRDVNDRPVNPNGKPPATRIFTYDEKGRLLLSSNFDADGTPVSILDWIEE